MTCHSMIMFLDCANVLAHEISLIIAFCYHSQLPFKPPRKLTVVNRPNKLCGCTCHCFKLFRSPSTINEFGYLIRQEFRDEQWYAS